MTKRLRALSHLGLYALVGLYVVVTMGRPPVEEFVPGGPSGEVCVAREANNYCAPVDDPDVAEAVESLRARGLRCPKTALQDVLPEALVVQHRDSRHVEVVSFDEALRLAEAGAVWVQRACH